MLSVFLIKNNAEKEKDKNTDSTLILEGNLDAYITYRIVHSVILHLQSCSVGVLLVICWLDYSTILRNILNESVNVNCAVKKKCLLIP